MDKQTELEFFKNITMGVLDKEHIEFHLLAQTWEKQGRRIEVDLRDSRHTYVGDNLDIDVSYYANVDDEERGISLRIDDTKTFSEWKNTNDPVTRIKALLKMKNQEFGSSFSEEKGKIDVYGFVEKAFDKIFLSKESLYLCINSRPLRLYEDIGLGYGDLLDSISVGGNIGGRPYIHDFCIEFGKSPKDNKYYLGLYGKIKEGTKPAGLYKDATFDMVIDIFYEQFEINVNDIEKK